MGALTLNTLVCALLYHPVEEHMIEIVIEGIDNEAMTLDEVPKAIEDKSEPCDNEISTSDLPTAIVQPSHFEEHLSELSKYLENTLNLPQNDNDSEKKIENEEKTNSIVPNQIDTIAITCEVSLTKAIVPESSVTTISRSNSTATSLKPKFHLTRQHSIVSEMGPISLSPRMNVPSMFRRLFKAQGRKKTLARTNNQQLETTKDVFTKDKKILDDITSEKSQSSNKFFDLSVLRDPLYLVILISNSTSAISNTNFMILLPSYAISEGFDKNMSALLLSIVSALDLVGRIGGASLSDIDFIPKYYYFVFGLGTSGIALALLPMATSYGMLSFFCALFGLSSGMYIGITTVILADMLGTEKLSSSYGISLFVNGVLQLVGPPVCGAIFEQVGTYKPIFLAFGIILILGTALWAAVPIINRKKKESTDEC